MLFLFKKLLMKLINLNLSRRVSSLFMFMLMLMVCGYFATANIGGGETANKPVKSAISTKPKGQKEIKGETANKPVKSAISTKPKGQKEVRGSFASEHFKKLLQKYQESLGVRMAFKKRAYFPLLKKSQSSTGEIFLSKKKILLTLKDHLNTQVLFDGKRWWHIVTPHGEAKRVSAIKPDQNISLLFQPDMLFQNFYFVSQEAKGRTQILNFGPKSQASPLQSLAVQVEQNRILKVWLKWQGSNNEEVFSFFNIRFNQKLSPAFFKPT